MGTLVHAGLSVELDDRLLAHVQIVVVQKFRRNEAFVMSWLNALTTGDGRSSTWLTPSVPVHFLFVGSRLPSVNEEWLQRLQVSASSSSGLILTTETGELARAQGPTRIA